MISYFGQLALTLIALVLSTTLGAAVMRWIFPSRAIGRSAEALALSLVLGSSAWILTFGWLSYLGIRAGVAALLIGLCAFAFVLATIVRSHRLKRPNVILPFAPKLAIACVVAAVVSLLPLAVGNAFDAANDTFVYIITGDYLQSHGFGPLVSLSTYQPLLGPIFYFQHNQIRIGAVFLLAFVQAALNGIRAIDVYPAVTAWGVSLNVAALFLLARWAVRLRHKYAILAAFFLAITPNAIQTAAAHGFFDQTFGTAEFACSLALLTRMLRAQRWNTGFGVATAVVTAALVSVYAELVPVLSLVALAPATSTLIRAKRRGRLIPVVKSLTAGLGLFCLLANIEIARAIHAIPIEVGAVAGQNVSWGILDYWSFSLGVRPGGIETPVIAPQLTVLLPLTILATMFIAIGMSRVRRDKSALTFLSAIIVFAGLIGYYTFVARNPWTGGRVQTWSLYKLAQWWSLPLMAAMFLGLQKLDRLFKNINVHFVGFSALAIVSFVPQLRLAQARAGVMRNYTHSNHPLDALEQLPETLDRLHVQSILLVSPHGEVFPKLLYTYFLYPKPMAGDWRDTPYISTTLPPSENLLDPVPPKDSVALGVDLYAADTADMVPGGAIVLKKPAIVSVGNPNGLETVDGTPFFWLGTQPASLDLYSPSDGSVNLTFDAVPGPSLPGPVDRRLVITNHETTKQEATVTPHLTGISVPVSRGDNQIDLQAVDAPTVAQPAAGDTRTLLLGVKNLRVELASTT